MNKLLSEEAKTVQQSAEAVSKAEEKPAVIEKTPQHHHDGVDLIKRDDAKAEQTAEKTEKPAEISETNN